MNQRILSRSQRRMERKQAIILLCLALAISLVSFSLGVMVGRSGHRPEPVAAAAGPVPLPRPAPLPAPDPPGVPQPSRPEPAGETAAPAPAPPPGPQDEALTFYDTLPRGEQPLGSGINLPPEPAATAAPAAATPVKQATGPKAAALPGSAVAPAVPAAAGQFVVQIASFKDQTAAEVMLKQLAAKGYALFVEPVDLGAKGVWYRVYAGPYAGRETADRVASQLRDREKISPLVRKR